MSALPDPSSNWGSHPHGGPPERGLNWGMLCHLSALLGMVGLPLMRLVPIPFGNIIGPLAVWLAKRKEYPFVDAQGKEALNFQISVTLYSLFSAMLIFVFIGVFLLIGLAVADIILVIIAAVKAANGEVYRYPLTIRFIK